jgi:hypothetical protein
MGWFCFNEFIHEIFCGYSRTVASNLGAALFLKKQVKAIKYITKNLSEAIKNYKMHFLTTNHGTRHMPS